MSNKDPKENAVPEEELKEEKTGEEAEEQKAEENKAEKTPEAKPAEPQQTESERYTRLYAEFANYKKRAEKEKADLYAYAGEKFAVDLLSVIDNFERAMDARPADDSFADGMELILKQLRAVMEKNHVEEIIAIGEEFNPNFHNAVMTEEVEGMEANKVTKVFQKGYVLNKKVIRPAMVVVSR